MRHPGEYLTEWILILTQQILQEMYGKNLPRWILAGGFFMSVMSVMRLFYEFFMYEKPRN